MTILRHLRGTAAKVNNYTGPAGELVIDTTNTQIRVQDGSTAGGVAVAKDEDATATKHGLMSAADKQNLSVLVTQFATLVEQVETISSQLKTLTARVDTYYSGYDGYPRS